MSNWSEEHKIAASYHSILGLLYKYEQLGEEALKNEKSTPSSPKSEEGAPIMAIQQLLIRGKPDDKAIPHHQNEDVSQIENAMHGLREALDSASSQFKMLIPKFKKKKGKGKVLITQDNISSMMEFIYYVLWDNYDQLCAHLGVQLSKLNRTYSYADQVKLLKRSIVGKDRIIQNLYLKNTELSTEVTNLKNANSTISFDNDVMSQQLKDLRGQQHLITLQFTDWMNYFHELKKRKEENPEVFIYFDKETGLPVIETKTDARMREAKQAALENVDELDIDMMVREELISLQNDNSKLVSRIKELEGEVQQMKSQDFLHKHKLACFQSQMEIISNKMDQSDVLRLEQKKDIIITERFVAKMKCDPITIFVSPSFFVFETEEDVGKIEKASLAIEVSEDKLALSSTVAEAFNVELPYNREVHDFVQTHLDSFKKQCDLDSYVSSNSLCIPSFFRINVKGDITKMVEFYSSIFDLEVCKDDTRETEHVVNLKPGFHQSMQNTHTSLLSSGLHLVRRYCGRGGQDDSCGHGESCCAEPSAEEESCVCAPEFLHHNLSTPALQFSVGDLTLFRLKFVGEMESFLVRDIQYSSELRTLNMFVKDPEDNVIGVVQM
ncbi:hypothetical protein PCE1_000596 [Barthelona sp. PCE]